MLDDARCPDAGTGRPGLAVPAVTVAAMTEPPRCLATVPGPEGPQPCHAKVWRDGVCRHHRGQAPPLPVIEPRSLITRRYSKVKGLRAQGILSPATPPCEIDGCRNRSPLPDHRGRGTGYVYEHCHQHDYIRGVTCGPCNVQMTLMDARVDTCASWPRFGAYLAWWLRCPTCAAGPPWEPWLTAYEYVDGPMIAELRNLARTEPGSAARDQAMMLLALHGRAIISRRHYRARRIQRAAAHAVLLRLRASVETPAGRL
jgi:recombination endonuclease VII